eukprot:Nk52_evm62s270 gene=Nk52_evmTU62s270
MGERKFLNAKLVVLGEDKGVINLELLEGTEVIDLLWEAAKVNREGVLLRVRNSKGSLVCISDQLFGDGSEGSETYTVEIVNQQVGARGPTVVPASDMGLEVEEALQSYIRKLSSVTQKCEMENEDTVNERLAAEASKIRQQCQFLQKRIEENDSTHWTGTFTKLPCW